LTIASQSQSKQRIAAQALHLISLSCWDVCLLQRFQHGSANFPPVCCRKSSSDLSQRRYHFWGSFLDITILMHSVLRICYRYVEKLRHIGREVYISK
ncbi:hypothetical protein KCU69_g36, partial [Aureobasidium melanogenum]